MPKLPILHQLPTRNTHLIREIIIIKEGNDRHDVSIRVITSITIPESLAAYCKQFLRFLRQ